MKDQSGPAFPVENVWASGTRQGMTKREVIAMSQMKAWRSGNSDLKDVQNLTGERSKWLAELAIQDADALLAELGME